MSDEKPRGLPLLHKLLLVLVVGLLTAEVGVRIADARAGRTAEFWLPPPDTNKALVELHPFLGYAHRPGAVKQGNVDAGGQIAHINSLRMRGREMAREKPAGTYRILCLGGSTTFGSGASGDETTYPARLEHYLNQAAPAGVTYEVGNCGVNGYTTVENLIYLQLLLVELDPDAIVIYQAANDARPIQAQDFQPDYTNIRRAWTDTVISPFEEFMIRNVRLFCWLTKGTSPDASPRTLGNPILVPGYGDLHRRSNQIVPPEGIDVFMRNLNHIALVAREHGIEPVLSTFAMCREKQQPNAENFLETVATINARVEAYAVERNVPLLRIAEALDGHCEAFSDWMHLNDEGSDLHGKAAADEARRLGLFGLE